MIKTKTKKICIVVSSLGGGGAERSSALLSHILDGLGYDIHIVSVLDRIDYSYKGTLFNLGKIKKEDSSIFGRINRLFIFKKYLKKNNIEIVIDARSRVQAYREFLVAKFIYTLPVIYVLHNYNYKKAFTSYRWLNTYLYKNKKMVAVSKAAEDNYRKTYALKNITTIYNSFDFENIRKNADQKADNDLSNYIIYFGRLDDEHKNLKLLFDAYKLSNLSQQNIKLLVLGGGPDEADLITYTRTIKINEYVVFNDFEKNPYPYIKNSLFSVLTSRYEGFPMAIPEALALGVPVVSVDCKSGPNEVVVNEYNGLLVENHNAQAFANAMNRMIEDKNLYLHCKENAKSSVLHLSLNNIGKQWKAILK